MLVQTDSLPTPLALVARRVNRVGAGASADSFLYASYLAESAIKMTGVAIYAALHGKEPNQAYRVAYQLLRANGLGDWDRVLAQHTSPPLVRLLLPQFQPLVVWATKKRTKAEKDWFRDANAKLQAIFATLGLDKGKECSSVRDLVTGLIILRNKTKAHGAVGEDFWDKCNALYIAIVSLLIKNCPAFGWEWVYRGPGHKRGVGLVRLEGVEPFPTDLQNARNRPESRVVSVRPPGCPDFYSTGDLLRSNIECTQFFLPNGAIKQSGAADFIDYASGEVSQFDVDNYMEPPAPLPPSATAGRKALDVQSSVFGNLPTLPEMYVERPELQSALKERLLDKNHPIVTLHGRGGVGKTLLAMRVAHEIARTETAPFEVIVWFSARDIELTPGGVSRVQQDVADLETISEAFGDLFGQLSDETEGTLDSLAYTLHSPDDITEKGILFVFDNFESLRNPREAHKFLDTRTHLPNKVLITSRERAFKADYPIEVKGMEYKEARELLTSLAQKLYVEGIVTDEVIDSIYDYAEGHAYVMRLIMGEIAKEKRYVPPKQLLPRRVDIVNSVFERSFSRLSDAGRICFLIVANWRSLVPEVGLLVTLAPLGLDADDGIKECLRFSLVSVSEMHDGSRHYFAPQLARVFASKKLEGDPDRLVVEDALKTIQHFGSVEVGADTHSQERAFQHFVEWCFEEAKRDESTIPKLSNLLKQLAQFWSRGWFQLAKFRRQFQPDEEEAVCRAYRRAVEENPFETQIWRERASYAEEVGNESARISSLVSAVEASPEDRELIRDVALELCKYVDEHKDEIPVARRGVYLASVRDHMKRLADELDATGLSRLAWLYLLEGNEEAALKYAKKGYAMDKYNVHCRKLVERLEAE